MATFNDQTIERLFGVSDGENESPARLKEYFFRNKAYENLNNDLAIRILVGHKGSGKSSLLRMLYLEDKDKELPAIWLQPGDLLNSFHDKKGSFNSLIENWKNVLTDVIVNEVVKQVQPDFARENMAKANHTAGAIFKFIREKIDNLVAGGSLAIQQDALQAFTRNNFLRIYIDDLDRGWEAKKSDIERISTLLNAIRDLCGSSKSLQFRVGLRTDVYYLVRTSDESTDKIEDKIVWLTWTNNDLLILFAKRIETFFGRVVDDAALSEKPQREIANSFSEIIEPVFAGRGKWSNVPVHRVLMSLQRKRPRDLIKLLGGAAKHAYQNGHQIITTNDLRETFSTYSAERLQDIVNEFKSEVPEIYRLLLAMKPTRREQQEFRGYLFTQAQMDEKIKRVLEQVSIKFVSGGIVTPRTVGQFLYKIDFIVARKEQANDSIVRRFFDQSRFLYDQYSDFGFSWEIHPAYRWALEPTSTEELFNKIELDPS